jgi:electron transfer flavoprotein alpha subunit
VKEMVVLAEHRFGQLRDVTWEMLSKGRQIAERMGIDINVVLLGKDVGPLAESMKSKANKVYLIEDNRLEFFNSEHYERALIQFALERKPLLTLIGHTAMGMELAPALATTLRTPLATDCIGIDLEGETLFATRQMYGGKVNAKISFSRQAPYMITVRCGVFPVSERDSLDGEIVSLPSPLTDDGLAKRFLCYIESAAGEVDITQADLLISVGRGIKDVDNIAIVKELADILGGTLSCSRPVADKKWLPKGCQVGTSGKTVKPKIYIAIGISGAFQHIAGIKNAGTVIAINKDPKAPIFSVAHYGIVGDLFKVVPLLAGKVREYKERITRS